MMGWYKDIKAILEQEPEVWLSYIYGQQLENIPHLTRVKPKYRGWPIQVAKFFKSLLCNVRFHKIKKNDHSARFFVFAGSLNQKNSLETMIDSLIKRGENVVAIAPDRLVNRESDSNVYSALNYSVLDVCKALFFFTFRGVGLYRQLRKIHPVAPGWYFAIFCSSYAYLSFFQRLLTQLEPEFVITANDHNAPNRCMLAMAHHLGIKTVYLQHASVSKLFPALRVNYAFLDGQSALDTYKECEVNQPRNQRPVPMPQIFLSGQKKHLARKDKTGNKKVGLAVNSLDDTSAVIGFVLDLVNQGCQVHLRWHPGQPLQDVKRYLATLSDVTDITLSDPNTETISAFFDEIGYLIAGNSSVHLEAALAGVTPIYCEITLADTDDYYGYVKSGLAKPAALPHDVINIINGNVNDFKPESEAVRYYSSTYLTEWDGNEGELVGECLSRIALSEELPITAKKLIEP